MLALAVSSFAARAAPVTYAADSARTGWYPNQPTLSGNLLDSGAFGKLWSAPVNGQVFAQPLVWNGVLFIATETNFIYGLDPATGATLWSRSLGAPFDPNQIKPGWACPDISPSIGVTGTPVIDDTTGTAYFVAKTSAPALFMHAVEVMTGAERAGFPVAIAGRAQNAPGVTFDPRTQLQRPAMLLLNGVVYAGFSGHCDFQPFHGFVAGISTAGALVSLWTDTASGLSGGGIWMAGSGPVSAGDGSLLLTTGNAFGGGSPAGSVPGNLPPGDLGESVVRLRPQADGSLKAVDFFSPSNANVLDNIDADLGSSGPVLLPPAYFGTAVAPHLLLQAGKQGYLFLLDADRLGGASQGTGDPPDALLGRVGPLGNSVFGRAAAVWPGDGGWIYVRTSGPLVYLQYGVDGANRPTLALAASSAVTNDYFGFTAGEPVVTSDGIKAGTALVWVIWMAAADGQNAQLRAYDALPVGGAPHLRWSSPIGIGSKFSLPGVAGGRLFVGTRDNHVIGFGSPVTAALSGQALGFPATALGTSSTLTETLTAGLAVTITALSASDARFAVGATSPPLPATLAAGDVLTAPVTFTPTAAGNASAILSVATNLGPVQEGMSGTGRVSDARLAATPAAVDFGSIAAGTQVSVTIDFSDLGNGALTFDSVTLPGAPFLVSGAPAAGAGLAPGGAVTVSVAYAPAATGSFTDHLVVHSSGGVVDVLLTGTATAPGRLDISPLALDFGTVEVGARKTLAFTVSNGGGTALTITRSKQISANVLVARGVLDEGTSLAPGQSVVLPIEFTPLAGGAVSGAWSLNSNAPGGGGAQTVSFTGQGRFVGISAAPDPVAGGWQLNGNAALAGPLLVLTPPQPGLSGSAFWPITMPSDGLDVSFVASLDSGSGGDGLALLFADTEQGAVSTSLGAAGPGLGFKGFAAVAVALGTSSAGGNPGSNYIGISEGGQWVASTTSIPDLRAAPHLVRVVLVGSTLVVSLDGAAVLAQQVTLRPQMLVGFSAGTSASETDRQAVSRVSIKSGKRLPELSIALTPSALVVSGTAPLHAVASGPVASFQIAIDGLLVAQGTAARLDYAWDTTLAANGHHLISASAVDAAGLTASATAPLEVYNAPRLSLTAPSSAAGLAQLGASADAPRGTALQRLSISVDGVELAAGPSPLAATWDVSVLPNGSAHEVIATAVDADGSTSSAVGRCTIANPPAVAVQSPASGASVVGDVTIAALATAPAGTTVASVVPLVDGAPLTGALWHTAGGANGAHALSARATDADGTSAVSPAIEVVVKNPPAVQLAAPPSTSGTTTLRATAIAPAGTSVAALTLSIDGTQVAAGAGPSLAFAWDTGAAGNGPHQITATATDADGASAQAAPVSVAVANGFALSLSPAALTLTAGGGDRQLLVSAAFTAAPAAVTLSATGLPTGVTALFEPPVLAPGGTAKVTLRATARAVPASAAAAAAFTVRGTSALGAAEVQGSIVIAPAAAVALENLGLDRVTFGVTLRATTPRAVTRIAIYDGSALLGESPTSPLVVVWDTRAASNGAHTLAAIATTVEGDATIFALEIAVANDFTLTLQPAIVADGDAFTVDTKSVGAPQPITLSAEGATFEPNPVAAGKSATGRLTSSGPRTFLVTGKTGSVPGGHSVAVTVTADANATSGCSSTGGGAWLMLGLLGLCSKRRGSRAPPRA